MTWTPANALSSLSKFSNARYVRGVKKLSAYSVGARHVIALAEENEEKVTVYSTAAPDLDDVVVEETYAPASVKRRGRHADLHALHPKLGWDRQLFRLEVKNERALDRLLNTLAA